MGNFKIYCKSPFLNNDLFQDLLRINWLEMTQFGNKDLNNQENNVPKIIENWFASKIIRDNDTLMIVTKMSRTRIKFGLQFCSYWANRTNQILPSWRLLNLCS